MALALFCLFIVPAMGLLRQSALNYSHAFADYQTDLALGSLIAQTKNLLEKQDISDISVNFSDYSDNGRYEYEVILKEFRTGRTRILRYPENGVLNIQPAVLTQTGDFTGSITAAVNDGRTGLIKVKALPY